MGKGDRRNSNKMLKRRSRERFKARSLRPKNLARPLISQDKKPVEEEPEAETESE